MRKYLYLLVAVFSTAAILAGCNLPFLVQDVPNAQTAAALTVQAQLSPVAGAFATPTLTPVPFPTLPPASTLPPANTLPPAATATSNCDNANFIDDVTVPDNTAGRAGRGFHEDLAHQEHRRRARGRLRMQWFSSAEIPWPAPPSRP